MDKRRLQRKCKKGQGRETKDERNKKERVEERLVAGAPLLQGCEADRGINIGRTTERKKRRKKKDERMQKTKGRKRKDESKKESKKER